MKIDIPYARLPEILSGVLLGEQQDNTIDLVAIDSRKIMEGGRTLFFALKGHYRDGHEFIGDVYQKGGRQFIVSENVEVTDFPGAGFILVKDTLKALQNLASFHRSRFSYPVVAITGSAGKTTVKEWLYHLLQEKYRIVRSPKSFNSQIGVALSLLEMHADCDLALIEAGISKPGEMSALEAMIRPTFGVFTSFGRAHEEAFDSMVQHLEEKLVLFKRVKSTFVSEKIPLNTEQCERIHAKIIRNSAFQKALDKIPFSDQVSANNAALAIGALQGAFPDHQTDPYLLQTLPKLALRMEVFDGIFGNTIINDTYNLDLDALTHALEYQLMVAAKKPRVVVVGLDEGSQRKKDEVERLIQSFHPEKVFVVSSPEEVQATFKDSVVLIKGTRKSDMQRYASRFRLKNHKTFVEVDLTAMRHNLNVYRECLLPGTKTLAMVKAQSYGSGLEKIGEFLEKQGVQYLGVAYADEGVELRKEGIKSPILVMNAEEEGFESCIRHNLEPAIYSLKQLDNFVRELIFQGIASFPVHLKIDTGMNRLGFKMSDLPAALAFIKAQPEVTVKSIYTHLAESDNRRDKRYTQLQLSRFLEAYELTSASLGYQVERHVLNSDGIFNFPEAHFEMVRIGIGMYGISSNQTFQRKLKPVLAWFSSISQLKKVQKGESVGYGRSFTAQKPLTIAVIPVGYADGFRRSLSNGIGGVYIHGAFCPTVGRVCMDMIMVDVTGIAANEGDKVEIMGPSQPIGQLAGQMQTIPYEVMTGISKRVHRIYLEE